MPRTGKTGVGQCVAAQKTVVATTRSPIDALIMRTKNKGK
jgi:hypothetical protein